VTARPRIGSLCTGYGGLDLAVQAVIGGELAFVADPDEGAAKILAHHHPHVPNLGDITTTDWDRVERVDVLTAGFPCQDISYAGRGAGIKEGTRSGLWSTVVEAVRALRPRFVFVENVSGIVSRRPGLDVVLADLAGLGFDAEWGTLRASDVGAPHPRNRWFLLAWPAAEDADLAVGGERRLAAPGQAQGGRSWADAGRRGGAPAADAGYGDEPERPWTTRWTDGQRPPVGGEPGRGRAALADPDGDSVWEQPVGIPGSGGSALAGLARESGGPGWGAYDPAIRRWERVTGRPAPAPTRPDGRNGGHRLSPVFVEWLMGLPAGWVTSPAIGLSRTQQLRALGNGVIPQQGAAALGVLLGRAAQPVAA
jgi:DNA (cytosine-5)-methyltransferase 1